ncbi:hypothetical protein HNY73_019897 [Argiope bruennichi]|uniref:Uncharacterized protein n=1 Tax=Argiope bruennichi TaxID=94029 RepID=A0A8T0E6H4_ARGBR|nr:hypothetical protein HNY73_019897 [Argiope bruennichi]
MMVEWFSLKLSTSIRFARLPSPSTAAKSASSSKSDGRLLSGLSAKLFPPYLKWANHALHRVSLIVPFPLARRVRKMTVLFSILSQNGTA